MKSIVFYASLLCCSLGWAQQSPVIQLDGTGKLRPTLPERLGRTDAVKFRITDPKESFDKYKKSLVDRLKQSGALLDKLKADQEKMDMLKAVFDIDPADIDGVTAEINQVIGNPFLAGATSYVPKFVVGNKQYFTVGTENTRAPSTRNMEPNDISDTFHVDPAATETQINFTVTKKDPFKKLVVDWLNSTKTDYAGTLGAVQPLLEFRAGINKMREEVEKFAAETRPVMVKIKKDVAAGINLSRVITTNTPVLNAIISKGETLKHRIDSLFRVHQSVVNHHNKKAWMLKWLWYQQSLLPAINPLGFVETIGIRPDTVELESLKIKTQVRESFLKSNLEKLRTSQVDSLLAVIDSLKRRIDGVQQAAKLYDEKKAKNEQAALAFRTTSQELNKGILLVGEKGNINYWMRHHNAAENYQLMNDLEKEEYLETDRVVILAHNLKPNETAKLVQTFTDITNDASQFSESLAPVIAQLNAALLTVGSSHSVRFDSLLTAADDVLQELLAKVDSVQLFERCIDYLLPQTNPLLQVEEKADASLAWHSEVTNPVKKITGPRKASYYLQTALIDKNSPDSAKINKLPADTFSYRINKLYRIFPMAGIAWTPSRFTNVTQDSAGQFKVDQEAPVKFVVGVKVYLKKTDIRSSKFIGQKDDNGNRLWLSRISFTAAFDARKPLDNIYTGAGFDLFPGACLNIGGVFNRYAYKTYKNGTVFQDKKPYRAGFYLGVSTDLTLFTELGKFLNF